MTLTRRHIPLITLAGSIAVGAFLLHYPINSKTTCLALTLSGLTIWISLIALCKKSKTARIAITSIPILLGLLIAFTPAREINQAKLRKIYVENLKSFENTDYIWGGENNTGIDCSGLPRKSLRLALLQQGIKNFDPALIRQSLLHWWNDASAKALLNGHKNYTTRLNTSGILKEIDPTGLLHGDFAITEGGAHVIIYLGDNQWIQADPSVHKVHKVHTLNAKTQSNLWFDAKVHLFTWTILK